MLTQRSIAATTTAILLAFFLEVGQAMASTEELIQSIFGGAPYLVAYPDDNGPSRREPGVYVRSGDDNRWTLIIPGKAIPAAIRGGLSMQLGFGKLTNRFESISLINGKATLFSVRSDISNPDSYVVLGSEQTPVRDPLDGTPISIPEVHSTKDISFYEWSSDSSEHLNAYTVVLVSIRAKTPLGPGLTFAAVLKPDEFNGDVLKLAYDPILLDWQFFETNTLSQKILGRINGSRNKIGFASQIVFSRLKTRAPSDMPVISAWRKLVAEVARGDIPAARMMGMNNPSNIPYLNIETGKLEIEALPSKEVSIAGAKAHVVYDPVRGRSGVVFPKSGQTVPDWVSLADLDSYNFRPLLHGPIQCVKNDCYRVETKTSEISRNRTASLVYMQDGRAFFVAASSNNEYSAIELRPKTRFQSEPIIAMSWYPASTPQGQHIVIVSWKLSNGKDTHLGLTECLELSSDANTFQVISSARLSDRFYTSEELALRTQIYNRDTLAFDDFTRNELTPKEYEGSHKFTAPHIDIGATLKNKEFSPSEYFPESLARESITKRHSYITYDEPVVGSHRTGIYGVVPENQRSPLLYAGQLLKPERPEHKSKTAWDGKLESVPIEVDRVDGKTEIAAVLLDKNFGNGKASADLVVLISPEDPNFTPTTIRLARLNDVDELGSFALIKAESGHKNNQRLMVAYIERKGTGTFLVPFYVGRRTADTLGLVTENGAISSNEPNSILIAEPEVEVTFKEVMSRLRFESGTKPFWVETPELVESDVSFRLKNLLDSSIFEPNRSKEKKNLTGADADGYHGSGYSSGATWREYPYDKELLNRTSKIKDLSEYQTDVFPQLRELAEDLANPARPARHVVLLVPQELRKYAEDYLTALRSREHDPARFWNDKNFDVVFFAVDVTKADQSQVIRNLEYMRTNDLPVISGPSMTGRRKRSVLTSSLASVQRLNRPTFAGTNLDAKFSISESLLKQVGFDPTTKNAEQSASSQLEVHSPHFLYLNAVEGARVPIHEFNPKPSALNYSSLFVGTKEEWQNAINDANFESKYGLADHYEVVELSPPTTEFRQNFVKNILTRSEIRNLNYRIDVKSFNRRKSLEELKEGEAESIAATYLVNRIESLSRSNNITVFQGFMKAMGSIASELTNNTRIRSKKVIDRGVIESLLLKTFAMPVNLNLLPADDPLKILARPDASFLWQQAGYLADPELKSQVINTILGQLTADEVRSASSSFIIFGETGSGKSEIIKSLIRMLNLREYSFSGQADNSGAWSFFLQCSRIYDRGMGGTPNSGMMTLEEAMAHLDTFLASENGERGFIWFDDLHLAPPKIRAALVSRIRSLIENPTFTVTVGRTIKERPTRNITVGVTLNPTDNKDRIARYTSDKQAGPTDREVILATLSGDDGHDIEKSIFNRFGALINLSVFPAEAKGPKLMKSLKNAASADFTNNQRYSVVGKEVISSIVKAFPKEDARTFLSTASRALIHLAADPSEHHRLFILTPKTGTNNTPPRTLLRQSQSGYNFTVSGSDQAAQLEEYIRTHVEALPFEASYRGRIAFTRFVLDNIRNRAIENLLWATGSDPRFSGDTQAQRYMGAPLNRAFYHHLQTVPFVQLEDLNFDPLDFGARTSADKNQFRGALNAMILEHGLEAIKLPKVAVTPSSGAWNDFANEAYSNTVSATRQHVLNRYSVELEQILARFVARLLRVDNVYALPQSEQWLKSLSTKDPDPLKELGTSLSEIVVRFNVDIFNPTLVESANRESQMSQYDAMRLFAMIYDKALTRLPWGKVSNFLIKSLHRTAEDMGMSQSPGVQHFLFESKLSPLIAIDTGLVLGLAKSAPYFDGVDPNDTEQQHKRFMTVCESLLSLGGSGK